MRHPYPPVKIDDTAIKQVAEAVLNVHRNHLASYSGGGTRGSGGYVGHHQIIDEQYGAKSPVTDLLSLIFGGWGDPRSLARAWAEEVLTGESPKRYTPMYHQR